jgi:S-ribosylhomocysteine lyase
MELIKSFTVNHDVLKEGMYISRKDRNTVTYDLRMKIPNGDDYLTPAQSHTLEHLCAMFLRNSAFGNEIVYFGPMGCMTGFYLVTFDTLSGEDALALVRDAMKYISEFPETEVPGAKKRECGNYKSHDIDAAKSVAKSYLEVMLTKNINDFEYPV